MSRNPYAPTNAPLSEPNESASAQAKSRPSVVTFALGLLVAAFAIPPLRVAVKTDWAELDRVGLITIVVLVLISLCSAAFLRAWKLAWWITVLGILLEAFGVLFEFAGAVPGSLARAQEGFDSYLLVLQYVFELVVLVLLLQPKARRWFGIGAAAAERSTSGVA